MYFMCATLDFAKPQSQSHKDVIQSQMLTQNAYSEVSNKKTSSLIEFEEKFHPARSYSILLVY